MSIKTTILESILEQITPVISATLIDTDGLPIAAASLDTFTLDLYNMDAAKTVINARVAQNILNANNVTIDVNGLVTWSLQALDTIIVDSTMDSEIHRAVFSWSYANSTKIGRYMIDMRIINLAKVI